MHVGLVAVVAELVFRRLAVLPCHVVVEGGGDLRLTLLEEGVVLWWQGLGRMVLT